MYGRDALDFINSEEAYNAGLGYEECNSIMPHNPEAYDIDGKCKDPDLLREVIERFLFLSDEDLDYSKIVCKFIA